MPQGPLSKVQEFELKDLMENIMFLYSTLLCYGFTHDVLKIPRSPLLENQDFVCEITFDTTGFSIDLIDDNFSHDEVLGFIKRAETSMVKELRSINRPTTAH